MINREEIVPKELTSCFENFANALKIIVDCQEIFKKYNIDIDIESELCQKSCTKLKKSR